MLNTHDRDGIAVIELAHGKVNALDLELCLAVRAAFAEVGPERAVVLTGAGRAFSAGVDLRRIVGGGATYASEFLEALTGCFLAVFDHPAPVVAAVNGPAIAGGCVLASACDRRLISRGPIGLAELAVGVPFPTSAVEIMRSVLGPRAADLVLTARNLDPAEADAVGLVDEIVAPEELVPRAVARAAELASVPLDVFRHTKRQLQGPARDRITTRAPEDDPETARLWATDDIQARIREYVAGLGTRH